MNEYVLIGASILLLISVLVSKVSDRFGIPALLLFLILGMLAGSDGPGGIYFDDPARAQFVGVIALVLILFSGGLGTDQQMLVGAVLGYGMGRAMLFLVNRIRLGYEGLYPVLTLSLVFLTFGLTGLIGGSGFLAVYLAGIVLGHHDFIHKRSLLRFHDGLAWIMQIAMFLTLGLLVFPSHLVPIIGTGLLAAGCLMFIARPISVFIGLLPSALDWREKVFISWVGLRGAAPIILATFPLLAGLPQAEAIFNVVFFVVLTSVLLQGTSIPLVARWLGVDAPAKPKRVYPIEYTPMGGLKSELKELLIPSGSNMAGKAIVELNLPNEFLVILIARDDGFVLPNGGTVLQDGDTLLVLSDNKSFEEVMAKLAVSESNAAD